MPFVTMQPPGSEPTTGPIVRAIIRVTPKTKRVWLTFNAEAQDQLFGGSIIGKCFHIQIGTGDHVGRARIVPDDNGPFVAQKLLTKGAAKFVLDWWSDLPSAPRNGYAHFETADNGVMLRLPDWARPNGKDGKLNTPGTTSLAKEGQAKARAAAR